MSTQVLDQATSTSPLSADQQARAAGLERELQLASAGPASPVWYSGAGAIRYGIAIAENSGGFAEINWNVSDSLGMYVIGQYDWVGVFANRDQALVNPNGNFLGGPGGWTNASKGGPFTTDVAIQPGMVAAYVIKNSALNYVTVAVSGPFPSPKST